MRLYKGIYKIYTQETTGKGVVNGSEKTAQGARIEQL